MSKVAVIATSQSYRVRVSEAGVIHGTHVYLGDFISPLNDWRFNPQTRQRTLDKRYYYYHRPSQTLYLPRYDLDRFITHCTTRGCEVDVQELSVVDGASVDIPIQPWFTPKDERQAKVIEHLSVSDERVLGVALQTGGGKTAATIKALSLLGQRSLITMDSRLNQWHEAILKFSQLKEEDIYVIQGAYSIEYLLENIDVTIFPKIILGSTPTLRAYAMDEQAYEGFPLFDEFCQRVGIGVRVVDEVHRHFHANLILDLRLHAAKVIVLTFTFENSRDNIRAIFDSHYPPSIRFGGDAYKAYINVYAYMHSSGSNGPLPKKAYQGRDGYSHTRLEAYLLKHRHLLEYMWDNVYSPIIHQHFINRDANVKRMLILCATVAMCEFIAQRIHRELQGYTASVFVSGTSREVFETSDFIVSTPGSAGTGTDIPGILTVYCSVSIRSSPTNKQILGRARERADGLTPDFIWSFSTDVKPQCDHHKARESILRPMAKSYELRRLPA